MRRAGGDEVSVNASWLREGRVSSDLLFDESGCTTAEPAGPEAWGRKASSGLWIGAVSRALVQDFARKPERRTVLTSTTTATMMARPRSSSRHCVSRTRPLADLRFILSRPVG